MQRKVHENSSNIAQINREFQLRQITNYKYVIQWHWPFIYLAMDDHYCYGFLDLQVKHIQNVTKFKQLKYRGANDENEKKSLNDKGGKLLRDAGLDFDEEKDYVWVTKDLEYYGYANYYLSKCENESTMVNEADASIYRQLVEIDTALGTTAGTQLFGCLYQTTRWDIIKVLFFIWTEITKYILDY